MASTGPNVLRATWGRGRSLERETQVSSASRVRAIGTLADGCVTDDTVEDFLNCPLRN